MEDFTTDWFDTTQPQLEAKCNARVTRTYKEIRIDWNVLMRLKQPSNSIAEEIYMDIMVESDPDIGNDVGRIKSPSETWNGTAEHSINGVITFEDEMAGSTTLKFNSTSNFPIHDVFTDVLLYIQYEEYTGGAVQDTIMPFHSVFTTEEYLENHKGLIPRNFICNN